MDEHLARYDSRCAYLPVQLPLIGRAAEAEATSPVELPAKTRCARKRCSAVRCVSRAKLRWRGCAVNRNAAGQSHKRYPPRTFRTSLTRLSEMAAELQAADERPTRERLRLIEGGTSKMKKISSF